MEIDYSKLGLDPNSFITRKRMAELSERIIGVRVSLNVINKTPPEPDAIVGKREAYRVTKAVDWLVSQIKPVAAEAAE